ncbi:unnamed protein product [Tuber melanosporum]|uniref:(Perigord truffle) hypothetical protein n=1 Tax=Tuber melanosporum (strain Mel28) TaxID=656061 RepID=D5G5B4_TUBMM|nr:uncharacterized protein GSTUM_00004257001 [Tuber melanosporum]CAZ79707.1 unnamed protein product [Tuber melanosporum]
MRELIGAPGNDPKTPTPENPTMFQGFEWHTPADQHHWDRLAGAVPKLKEIGITALWIPPACKAGNPSSNGYDIYDLYDLGEFDHKWSRPTKWGHKESLIRLRDTAKHHGIGLIFDAVLNHKANADYTERCRVVEVNPEDRNEVISEPYEIDGWLYFDFATRGDRYSQMKYHWYHFSGTDYNQENQKTAIYKIIGDNEEKEWCQYVDTSELGNYDYLMFANLDYSNPDVCNDVKNWGVWVTQELGLKGFRFDAVRHFSLEFLKEFIDHLDKTLGEDWFFVGEYWKGYVEPLEKFLDEMDHRFSLFDFPLLENIFMISNLPYADLRTIFDGALVERRPLNAVTFVTSHDTQSGQDLERIIPDYFKPLAYALILLRAEGYPCVFFGDIYGIKGNDPSPPACSGALPSLVLARKLYAYGDQNDFFDDPNCIGWVRRGTHDRKDGCAVLMSNFGDGEKRIDGDVKIGDDGWAKFRCYAMSVSVWVNKAAEGRDRFGDL